MKQPKNKQSIKAKRIYDWTRKDIMLEYRISGHPLPPSKSTKPNNLIYYAIARENQFTFTDSDRLTEYESSKIISPKDSMVVNLFINGILQPPILYKVEAGKLTLLSTDAPLQGNLIILQFICFLSGFPLSIKFQNQPFLPGCNSSLSQ
ncbi:hypothetical protein AJ85_15785 [Alkalihalobacillus alcalophilus ATCC 27647 = CGMCC 1.3604]|uniref:DUF4183 domain-containing protein n=1 Tax=Alkalihalobacillus alcalophilus ATCC 27647 = CGMCC 1.3604 TaxID=1218173 RepID=A0A4S4JWU1_ALKAL|nr:DUF4183 domain-containing protein [Alkalihalobacillus alcalophilus]MED1560654.1 DUF4183 domain-containing protein [Alkalihalobacillus alcalophilus]THG89671.1 hypothetical protein AJ85_15785 [Alkalihalobacillus alcalophilus ATCC 27647 = CGMCC 1.3604]